MLGVAGTFNKLHVLSAFNCTHCLSLEKLPHDAELCDVEKALCTKDTSSGPGLCVCGKWMRNWYPKFLSKGLNLTIVADNESVRNIWVNLMRMRVAPSELLSRRLVELMNSRMSILGNQWTIGCMAMMHGWGRRLLKACDLRKVQDAVEGLNCLKLWHWA